jgi:glycosyltransferase involved in cell wall biosynthesis
LKLMIGTDQAGQGGISSVVSVLERDGFLQRENIKYIPSHIDGTRWEKLSKAIEALFSVLLLCAVSRPSIVHAHAASRASFMRKSIYLGMARTFGCKTIFHLHGGEFHHFAEKEAGFAKRWWIRRTLQKSTKVIALSRSWAEFLERYAPDCEVCVVPNAVQFSKTAQSAKEEPGRILFLGRPEKEKGIFELLTAIDLIKDNFPALKLAIAGDGDLEALQNHVDQKGIGQFVEILGWIDPDRRASELARATIFVLPSYNEGLPMAMLEAMSAGKAIIVTPVGGIPETVTDNFNGLFVPPADDAALSSAINKLLTDKTLRDTLGRNARQTIELGYSTDTALEKLAAVYAEIETGN